MYVLNPSRFSTKMRRTEELTCFACSTGRMDLPQRAVLRGSLYLPGMHLLMLMAGIALAAMLKPNGVTVVDCLDSESVPTDIVR